MLTVGLGYDEHADGSVHLRIESLHARVGVAVLPVPLKMDLGSSPAFVFEDENDFSLSVNALIVVIAKLWRGDAITGKDEIGVVSMSFERRRRRRELPLLLRSLRLECNVALRAVVCDIR